jgi:hypothetical protein
MLTSLLLQLVSAKSVVFQPLLKQIPFFWVMTPFGLVYRYQCSEAACCLYLENSPRQVATVKMTAASSSAELKPVSKSKHCNNSVFSLQQHSRENLISRTVAYFFGVRVSSRPRPSLKRINTRCPLNVFISCICHLICRFIVMWSAQWSYFRSLWQYFTTGEQRQICVSKIWFSCRHVWLFLNRLVTWPLTWELNIRSMFDVELRVGIGRKFIKCTLL